MSTTESQKYLDMIIDEPAQIGRWLGFEDLTDLHNGWIQEMMFAEDDVTLLAHRGSYKTTCLSIAIALLMILFPKITIIFFRKTDTDVKEVIKQVANILKSDVLFLFVKKIYGVEIKLTEVL